MAGYAAGFSGLESFSLSSIFLISLPLPSYLSFYSLLLLVSLFRTVSFNGARKSRKGN